MSSSRKFFFLSDIIRKRENLIINVIFPIVLSSIGALVGAILSQTDIIIYNSNLEDKISPQGWFVLILGYVLCLIIPFFTVRNLKAEGIILGEYLFDIVGYVIFLGLVFFLSVFIGAGLGTISLNLLVSNFNREIPPHDAMYDTTFFFATFPVLAYLVGGEILTTIFLFYNRNQVGEKLGYTRGGGDQQSGARTFNRQRRGKEKFELVSFEIAVKLLDSNTYERKRRMNIEFKCIVVDPASIEIKQGPAPYRKLLVTDKNSTIFRTLHVWGNPGFRYNIELVESLLPGTTLMIRGPKRPSDFHYYKDQNDDDVFWIESWNGSYNSKGTQIHIIDEPDEPMVNADIMWGEDEGDDWKYERIDKVVTGGIPKHTRVFKLREEAKECAICKQNIKNDEEVAICPGCQTLFHESHFGEWIRQKGSCPICKKDIVME